MRGSGVGSIFSSIFRHLIPIASSIFGIGKKVLQTKTGERVLEAVKRPAMQAGLDIAKDALDGENLLKSIKKHGKTAGQSTMSNLVSGKGKGGKGGRGKGKGGAGSRGRGKGCGGSSNNKRRKKMVVAKNSLMSGL